MDETEITPVIVELICPACEQLVEVELLGPVMFPLCPACGKERLQLNDRR